MQYYIMPLHRVGQARQVGDVSAHHIEPLRVTRQKIQTPRRKIVEHRHAIHFWRSEQPLYRVASNEAGAPGDKCAHVSLL